MTTIQYAPWSSDIELSFYAALAALKIDKDRLDDSARRVLGLYELRSTDVPNRSSRMQIHGSALTVDEVPAGLYRAEGWIKNFNTMEDYKAADRTKILDQAARTIWDAIQDDTIYSCPSLLSSFYAISFANLKRYKFTYHWTFPALHSDPPWKLAPNTKIDSLSPKETTALVDSVQTWKYAVDSRQHGFFLAKRIQIVAEDESDTQTGWQIASIGAFRGGFFDVVPREDRFCCFVDPSTYPENPGWALRNFLVLIRQKYQLDDVQILCYRDTPPKRDQPKSIIMRLQTTPMLTPLSELPKVTGWERTDQNKLSSRTVDLGAYMDPTRLADQAVDLNLKLIKWRIAPSIDLDCIKNTSCLLLGAGTLGSYVSRNLMGWGVRKITFVDSATVSFSNPVRQPLFRFEDCLNGGVPKAIRAAEALKEIYPGVDARGEVMNVPMYGHPILDQNKTMEDFQKLKALIEEHDVIFLLLDTRESRWLPTLMGKSAGKIVLNAALGFESYVVLRQGLRSISTKDVELGCYFCNDVVAPADSLKDATLDQQCTVTRPGIAPIASALLVELLVSILQHPLRARAPAPNPTKNASSAVARASTAPDDFEHPLGLVPHTLRGFLSNFSTMQIVGEPYPHCSACSNLILDAYEKDGWAFVQRALGEKGWVEEISGLAEVQRKALEAEADVDWSEDEDGDGELL